MKLLINIVSWLPIKTVILWIMSRLTHRRRGLSDTVCMLFKAKPQVSEVWTRNNTSLKSSSVAIVTIGGLYQRGSEPFKEGLPAGDFTYRVISRDLPLNRIAFSKYFLDKRLPSLDPGMLFPIKCLQKLKEGGHIREVASNHFSFYSYTSKLNRVIDGSSKDVARRLRYEGVDKVLVIPASILAQETALLVQRTIEDEGIPTASLCYTKHIADALKPPRACVVTKGSLFRQDSYLQEDVQMNLVRSMLDLLEKAPKAGTLEKLTMKSIDLDRRPEQSKPKAASPKPRAAAEDNTPAPAASPEGIKKDLFE